LPVFDSFPILTIIRLVMFTASWAKRRQFVELQFDGTVALARRGDAVRPVNAKRSDVKKILRAAAEHFEELAALWEAIHEEK
jgi:hypothetical protein